MPEPHYKDYEHLINLKKKRIEEITARIEEIDAKLLKEKEMKDMVNKPPHYLNKIECLDIIEQQVKGRVLFEKIN